MREREILQKRKESLETLLNIKTGTPEEEQHLDSGRIIPFLNQKLERSAE